jgi:glycosyltransferase involved in cell wall biosynthesis
VRYVSRVQTCEKIYFIVDFTATRKYFHQYPLITKISRFLLDSGFKPHILLPVTAERKDIELTHATVDFILDSGYSSRNYKIVRHSIHKLLTVLKNQNVFISYLKKNLIKRYIRSALCFFQKLDESKNKNIVFPTLDPLSLQLAKQVSEFSNMKNFFFYFRVIGSESRGPLSSNLELQTLRKLASDFPSKIKIGVETNGYRTYLENLGFDSDVIFWSPWPSYIDFENPRTSNRRFTIGFLGCAKQRKGFDLIPTILNQLKGESLDFQVLIQETNFPWADYPNTKESIELIMGKKVTFLSGDLNISELQNYISHCNLMILPYDAGSYSINASGVLYHASDLNVPVLTAKGVGFESEIIDFSLGGVYDKLDKIPALLQKLQTMEFGFAEYNSQRNLATHQFFLD